jgi:regulatory protein
VADQPDSPGSEAGRGLGVAYAYLNRRERTVAEVRARLERADIRAEEIDEVVAELVEFGYLDDARYARVFTQDKRTLEAWGNERIARSLRERGVERELIAAALMEEPAQVGWDVGGGPGGGSGGSSSAGGEPGLHADGGMGEDANFSSEFERAVTLLHQRFPSGPAAQRDRERAFGVLARKGYESETAADAVREWARRAAA